MNSVTCVSSMRHCIPFRHRITCISFRMGHLHLVQKNPCRHRKFPQSLIDKVRQQTGLHFLSTRCLWLQGGNWASPQPESTNVDLPKCDPVHLFRRATLMVGHGVTLDVQSFEATKLCFPGELLRQHPDCSG